MRQSDVTTATIRTAVPTAWAALLAWAVGRFGLDLSAADWQVLCLLLPIVAGILYRAGRVLEARWPRLGFVLFGSARTPTYAPTEPGR